MAEHIISKADLASLKATKGGNENVIMTLGQTSKGDNRGSLYYWDALSTEAEDTTYYYVVQVTGVTIGRWKKAFTRVQTLPHGILYINSGMKEFYASSVTIGDGTCTIYLTMDGTATGTAIFTNILFDDSKATVNTATINDMVSSCRKSLSANLKELVHLFGRGNSTAVSVLGVNILGLRTAVANTPVSFSIKGM